MHVLSVVAALCGVVLAILLVILGLRGRFGTAREQGRFLLGELEHSDEVPRRTIARDIVTCRGSTVAGHAPIGAGVLWLTGDTLGFVRRTPLLHLRIPVRTIESVTVTSTYRRAGIVDVADGVDFVVVAWAVGNGEVDTIAWLTPDPNRWAASIEAAVSAL